MERTTSAEWVKLTGVLLQLFAVSRIAKHLGVRSALLFLPAAAFFEYGTFLVAPILCIFTVAKVGESALEYSLQNTARQALFLVGSRVEKYVGKTVVETSNGESQERIAAEPLPA